MVTPLKVALVTTWDTACGIASHSAYLKEAVEAADPLMQITPVTDLHPRAMETPVMQEADCFLLNYQAALLSQWHPEYLQTARARGKHTVVVWHDSGVPNTDQAKGICAAATAFVLHEPYDDLEGNGRYWRMGVPALDAGQGERTRDSWSRPILGTMGFDLPWKSWDELAVTTAAIGWGFLICTPAMTEEHEQTLRQLTPWLTVRRGLPCKQVVRDLSVCDATAFTFACQNGGQSASILQGIAAGKPVIAFSQCRQMRSLYEDPLGRQAIRWCTNFDDVGRTLKWLVLGRFDPLTVALATQDSWQQLGMKYAALLHGLVR